MHLVGTPSAELLEKITSEEVSHYFTVDFTVKRKLVIEGWGQRVWILDFGGLRRCVRVLKKENK